LILLELSACAGVKKTPTDLYCKLLKIGWLWLRGVDLNHRPLGYEFKGKLIQKNLQAHG
jgi:hypothetical protein